MKKYIIETTEVEFCNYYGVYEVMAENEDRARELFYEGKADFIDQETGDYEEWSNETALKYINKEEAVCTIDSITFKDEAKEKRDLLLKRKAEAETVLNHINSQLDS